jgi:hypothetical protein
MMRLRPTATALGALIGKYERARKCPWGWGEVLGDLSHNVYYLQHVARQIRAPSARRLNARLDQLRDRFEAMCGRRP